VVVTAGITVTSPLVVGRDLTVQGSGSQCAAATASATSPAPVQGLCTLSGGGLSRLFQVYSASTAVTLSLASLALVQGSDVADGLGGGAVLLLPGGTAAASPSLEASGCVFQANAATGVAPGAAIAANPSTLIAASMGLTLTDTSFLSNTATVIAGAVLASGPTVLSNVSFTGNYASFPAASLTSAAYNVPGYDGLGFAGALLLGSCAANGGSLSITGGAFANNWGTQGGAVMCGPGCACAISGTTFTNNTATGTINVLAGGGSVLGSGGAVAVLPGATLLLSSSTLTDNSCGNEGGAIFLSGNKQGAINNAIGGLFGFAGHAGVTSITQGTSVAIQAAPAQGTITSCTFSSNEAGMNGGSAYVEGASGVLTVIQSSFDSDAALKMKGGSIFACACLCWLHQACACLLTVFRHIQPRQPACPSQIRTSPAAPAALRAELSPQVRRRARVSCCARSHSAVVTAKWIVACTHACVVVVLNTTPLWTGASATLLLSGGIITGCSTAGTGGGVFLDASAVGNVSGVLLDENSATTLGGGIYVSSSATLSAVNVTWTSNDAASGGGLVIGALASATVQGSSFSSNWATSAAGALLGSSAASVTLTSCTFQGNTAAGLAPHGGAVSMENTALVSISSCTFGGDAALIDTLQSTVGTVAQLSYAGANTGGALFLGAAPANAGGVPMTATIVDTQFVNCTVSGSGGALAALGQTSMITLSIGGATAFSANNAGVSGGALALSGSVTTTVASTVSLGGNTAQQNGGAAALSDGSSTTFSGTTFTANAAVTGSGGALFLQVRRAADAFVAHSAAAPSPPSRCRHRAHRCPALADEGTAYQRRC
jgi:predicted outer membrane repeat protein